jgi:CheY-like chemotaxis protein
VDVNELLTDVTTMLRPMLPSIITMRLAVDSEVPQIMCDRVMMQQMLLNLCINARDAMQGHGHIQLHAVFRQNQSLTCSSCHSNVSGDFVELGIEDSGEGISPDVVKRIFDPFMTTKAPGKGTGMGLAMVHGIVHDHGGHVTVESAPGKTIFRVFLTAAEQVDEVADDESLKVEKVNRHDGSNILVVDDEIGIAEYIRELLGSVGYQVTIEQDSETALAMFKKDPMRFDMVVTDQTMPKMTGSEMAQAMLSERPGVPILLCTGYSEAINEKQARELGIRAFCYKPVDSKTLLSVVEEETSHA